VLGKRLEEVNHKITRFNDKDAKEEKETLEKVAAILEQKKWVRTGDWNNKEIEVVNKHFFLTSK